MESLHNSDDVRPCARDDAPDGGFVDIHCHCLPGLDDGPPDLEQALRLCCALVRDGVTTVVATPHQLGRYDGRNSAATIRQAVANLNQTLSDAGVLLTVLPGADVRLDERIRRLIAEDQVLTLADGGRHLLLELPHDSFINPTLLLAALQACGIVTIVSHIERNAHVVRHPEVVLPWLQHGAMLQLTAGSLLGEFGPVAQQAAWYWLPRAPVIIASDAHDVSSRPPRMSAAFEAIARRLSRALAVRVCVDAPSLIVASSAPAPIVCEGGRG